MAHGKITTDQSINARSLMMAEYYKVIVETGDENSVPLIASMKPVCYSQITFFSQRNQAEGCSVMLICVSFSSVSWQQLLLVTARSRTR